MVSKYTFRRRGKRRGSGSIYRQCLIVGFALIVSVWGYNVYCHTNGHAAAPTEVAEVTANYVLYRGKGGGVIQKTMCKDGVICAGGALPVCMTEREGTCINGCKCINDAKKPSPPTALRVPKSKRQVEQLTKQKQAPLEKTTITTSAVDRIPVVEKAPVASAPQKKAEPEALPPQLTTVAGFVDPEQMFEQVPSAEGHGYHIRSDAAHRGYMTSKQAFPNTDFTFAVEYDMHENHAGDGMVFIGLGNGKACAPFFEPCDAFGMAHHGLGHGDDALILASWEKGTRTNIASSKQKSHLYLPGRYFFELKRKDSEFQFRISDETTTFLEFIDTADALDEANAHLFFGGKSSKSHFISWEVKVGTPDMKAKSVDAKSVDAKSVDAKSVDAKSVAGLWTGTLTADGDSTMKYSTLFENALSAKDGTGTGRHFVGEIKDIGESLENVKVKYAGTSVTFADAETMFTGTVSSDGSTIKGKMYQNSALAGTLGTPSADDQAAGDFELKKDTSSGSAAITQKMKASQLGSSVQSSALWIGTMTADGSEASKYSAFFDGAGGGLHFVGEIKDIGESLENVKVKYAGTSVTFADAETMFTGTVSSDGSTIKGKMYQNSALAGTLGTPSADDQAAGDFELKKDTSSGSAAITQKMKASQLGSSVQSSALWIGTMTADGSEASKYSAFFDGAGGGLHFVGEIKDIGESLENVKVKYAGTSVTFADAETMFTGTVSSDGSTIKGKMYQNSALAGTLGTPSADDQAAGDFELKKDTSSGSAAITQKMKASQLGSSVQSSALWIGTMTADGSEASKYSAFFDGAGGGLHFVGEIKDIGESLENVKVKYAGTSVTFADAETMFTGTVSSDGSTIKGKMYQNSALAGTLGTPSADDQAAGDFELKKDTSSGSAAITQKMKASQLGSSVQSSALWIGTMTADGSEASKYSAFFDGAGGGLHFVGEIKDIGESLENVKVKYAGTSVTFADAETMFTGTVSSDGSTIKGKMYQNSALAGTLGTPSADDQAAGDFELKKDTSSGSAAITQKMKASRKTAKQLI